MTKKAQALLEQALALSPAERLKLARRIEKSVAGEKSVEGEEFDLHPEWRAEIERRVERIVSGTAKGIPIEKAIKTLRRAQERDDHARGKASSR